RAGHRPREGDAPAEPGSGSAGASPSRGTAPPRERRSSEGAAPTESGFPDVNSRKQPAHGVRIDPIRPTIVLLTVCTKDRRKWLASAGKHRGFRDGWAQSQGGLGGRYVLMPDHLHLFAAPGSMEISLEEWVQ